MGNKKSKSKTPKKFRALWEKITRRLNKNQTRYSYTDPNGDTHTQDSEGNQEKVMGELRENLKNMFGNQHHNRTELNVDTLKVKCPSENSKKTSIQSSHVLEDTSINPQKSLIRESLHAQTKDPKAIYPDALDTDHWRQEINKLFPPPATNVPLASVPLTISHLKLTTPTPPSTSIAQETATLPGHSYYSSLTIPAPPPQSHKSELGERPNMYLPQGDRTDYSRT